jgi:hypothetical protein
VIKFCSLQVSPESQYSTGHFSVFACGGRNTEKVIGVPVTAEW